MVRKILPLLLVLACLSLTACGEYGKVEQGRVVAFDKSTTPPTVTFIKDAGTDDKHPHYTVLPALTFSLPTDPAEVGQAPKVGLRLQLDVEAKIITMYDPSTKEFDKIPFELVENHENVNVRKQHPLVYDRETRKERSFPVVKADEQTVTIYSSRQQMLSTIKLAPEYFQKYTDADWSAGDEIRIYFSEPGKCQRFMNVSQTDFSKRK